MAINLYPKVVLAGKHVKNKRGRAAQSRSGRWGVCVCILCTVKVVEHSEAVCVVMAEELSLDDGMMLLHHVHVALVKLWSEPGLAPLLLKEPWRNVANNVHLKDESAIV